MTQPMKPRPGVVEWLRPGEYERVERIIQTLQDLEVTRFRTAISWADWHTGTAEAWYSWLLPTLAAEVEVLPCVLYTPPSLGIIPRAAAPPREPKAFADFLDLIITEFGQCFEWVELWNEPNNRSEYDWTLDPEWTIFSEMIGGAAYWAQQRGKRAVLGGMSPADPNWLRLMGSRGVLKYIDAVGIHGFPGVWEAAWRGWDQYAADTRAVLDEFGSQAEIWITETGYSTWRHDHHGQLQAFLAALEAPVSRMYWYGLEDLNPQHATVDGFHSDERDYHFGLTRNGGCTKLLCRVLTENGVEGARELASLARRGTRRPHPRQVVITGGAGFVGCNLADRLLSDGRPVCLVDNLARPGVEANLRWLADRHGPLVDFHLADVRDPLSLRRALPGAQFVYHLAGQVAVTTSLDDPEEDFAINAGGTLNLLEELRRMDDPPPLVFTSTNKVYGALEHIPMRLSGQAYEPVTATLRRRGIAEDCPLSFCSPYGCSKGTADQYVLDYAHSYGLRTVVFRMSCIYGTRQRGTEDQGWVAHFLLQALRGEPITLYGDGCQVRDILFVDDLVRAFLLAERHVAALCGRAFNIGGGPANAVSLLDVLDQIEQTLGRRPETVRSGWRTGDQRYYVSDTSAFTTATGWAPQVGVPEGLWRLHEWLSSIVEPEALALVQSRA